MMYFLRDSDIGGIGFRGDQEMLWLVRKTKIDNDLRIPNESQKKVGAKTPTR